MEQVTSHICFDFAFSPLCILTATNQYLQTLEVIEIVDDRVGVIVLITVTEEEYEEEILNVLDTVGVLVVTKLVELKRKSSVSYTTASIGRVCVRACWPTKLVLISRFP